MTSEDIKHQLIIIMVCHSLGCPALRQGILKGSVWCVILWAALPSDRVLKRSVWCVILWCAIRHIQVLKSSVWCAILWAALPSDTGTEEVCLVCHSQGCPALRHRS